MKTFIKLISLALFAICLAVSCKKDPVMVSSVTVSPASVAITEGESVSLKAAVSPSDAEYSGITWSSSNSSVAMVGSDGTVLAVSPGTATVSASAGGKTGSASITVVAKTINVTGVSLDKTELEMIEGDSATLTATVLPEDASDKTVKWTSSDESVAKVSSSGEVTAVKPGSTTITVTTTDGGKTAVCKITVMSPAPPSDVLPGKFTINSNGDQVCFSRGNLQATFNKSVNRYSWGFADNQYDCVGNAAGNTTIDNQSDGAVVDLFCWSTPSTNFGIYSTSEYYAAYNEDFLDWGGIIGDNDDWRTLSIDEWQYLFETRTNASGLYKTGVTVCGKTTCLVIAPDGYTGTIASSYDASTWPLAEAAGLVCLPAVGYRYSSDFYHVGLCGYYWSSSVGGIYTAHSIIFLDDVLYHDHSGRLNYGNSVRLVTKCK